jgi:hypothetical protein
MKYLFIASIILFLWMAFEIWRAPHLDDNGNVIKPAKKLKDLFK